MMGCYKQNKKPEKINTNINHYQNDDRKYCHKVYINKNSKLYKILNKEKINVNSYHRYCSPKSDIYKIVAKSSDGVMEAIEHPNLTFNIGIQWHPEKDYNYDINSKLILKSFIKEAEKYKN